MRIWGVLATSLDAEPGLDHPSMGRDLARENPGMNLGTFAGQATQGVALGRTGLGFFLVNPSAGRDDDGRIEVNRYVITIDLRMLILALGVVIPAPSRHRRLVVQVDQFRGLEVLADRGGEVCRGDRMDRATRATCRRTTLGGCAPASKEKGTAGVRSACLTSAASSAPVTPYRRSPMSLLAIQPTDHPAPPVARRPRSRRPTSRPGSHAAAKARKVSFYLSPEAVRRLAVAAAMSDSDRSRILEMIIAESPTLRRWVVSDRAKSADPATGEVSAS
jgi:hypothetical protein